MKNYKILLLVLIFCGLSAWATENIETDPVIPVPVLRAQIVEILPTGDFDLLKDTLVKIHFTYNTSGEIVVLNILSNNKKLIRHVKKYLHLKKVELPGEVDKIYYLPLKIKVDNS